MSTSRRRTDAEFIAADGDPLSDDDLSHAGSDSDEGPSSRPQRDRRAPKRLEEEQEEPEEPEKGQPKKRKGLVRGKQSSKGKGRAWEGDFEHTWDNVQEDERGTLEGAVSGALLSGKTRRYVVVLLPCCTRPS